MARSKNDGLFDPSEQETEELLPKNETEQEDFNDDNRLSWHIDNGKGWRAGKFTHLGNNKEWRKII